MASGDLDGAEEKQQSANMQMSIPALSTQRLLLRAATLGDFEQFATFLGTKRSRWMGGPYNVNTAWGFFCHEVASWQLFGHGGLAMELKSSGECVGFVEINDGPLFPEKELGWQVYEQHEGYGYVTEAASAYRDWAFSALGLSTLVSYIDPGNIRSIAVAERLNGILDTSASKQDPDDLVYRYLARD